LCEGIFEEVMKQLKKQIIKYFVTFSVVLVTTMAQANNEASDSESRFGIRYDKESDHLTVAPQRISLIFLLRGIAKQSGIEVEYEDLVDEQVAVDVNADSLERGLEQILKGRNYSFRYGRDKDGNKLLTAVTVLPVGKRGTEHARKLMPIESEAYYRSRSQLSHEQVQNMDLLEQRWRSRVEMIPPARREKIMAIVSENLLKKEQYEQRKKERKLNNEKRRREIAAKRKQEREMAWEGVDPEKRAAFEARGNAAAEHIRGLIHNQQ